MSAEPCTRCGLLLASPAQVCPGCLLSAQSAPERIGDWVLEEELGRGGMGTVFRARDVRLGRAVALKFIAPELASDPEVRRRFEREARVLAALSHPGIVTLHGAGEVEGELFLEMELVEAPTLAARLPLPPAEAVSIVRQLCDALAYAHARGVIHRDLKPANVLVDAQGRAKLSDFGIARLLSEPSGTLTRPGMVPGTPPYLAPEARSGAEPDARMDVFGVGALLYELLTASPPVGHLLPLPRPLEGVVQRALAPDPARRFGSVEELSEALARLPTADGPGLPADERLWMRAAAALQAVAVAMCLWAGLAALTPRVSAPGAFDPLVALAAERLPDGRVVTWARFETGPILAALVMLALAAAATGALRAHWRRAGLEAPAPNAPLREARWVFGLGVATWLLYGARRGLDDRLSHGLTFYMPVLGGLLELAVVYLACLGLLEATRRSRPLRREPLLWVGLALALLPPSIEFTRYVGAWHP